MVELTEPEWQACSGRQGRRRAICCSRGDWEALENPKGHASRDQSINAGEGSQGSLGIPSANRYTHSLLHTHTTSLILHHKHTYTASHTHTHTYVLYHIQILCTTHTYTSCIPHSITYTHTPSDTHTTSHTSHTVQHTHIYCITPTSHTQHHTHTASYIYTHTTSCIHCITLTYTFYFRYTYPWWCHVPE